MFATYTLSNFDIRSDVIAYLRRVTIKRVYYGIAAKHARSFERKGRRCYITTKVLVTCRISSAKIAKTKLYTRFLGVDWGVWVRLYLRLPFCDKQYSIQHAPPIIRLQRTCFETSTNGVLHQFHNR